ncbi:MAG: DUF2461 domain-containing protein [Acidobacteria bacterium]|nr:DUF2461 domain-containing protein [Acidobacteriota bacterium]
MRSGFPGFPPPGISFLRGLKRNNKREWFQPRKEIFEQSVKTPMEQMVEAINAEFVKFAPQYMTEPRSAIYRIYRDTRFSKDKTPYKTHVAASLTRSGMQKHISAGFYFSVAPDEIEVAGGIYMPGPDQLRAIRDHLAEHHDAFRRLIRNTALRRLMGELWGDQLARTPKGYLPDHPAEDLIRYKQWIFYDTRLDAALATTPKLLVEIIKRFQAMTPFVEFLNQPLRPKRPRDPLLAPW